MKRQTPSKPLREPQSGASLTREEIQDVLLDEGYSAGQRKEWLKTVLTQLSAEQSENPDPERSHLISEVKEIVKTHQSGKPMSDDIL